MTLHTYAPENLREFLDVLRQPQVLPVTVAKAKSSHSVHATIPVILIEPLKKAAIDLGLEFSIGRYYKQKKCQIVVKAT